MRIVVFGASGGCGKHFVRMAAEDGHAVSAVVRAETPYEAPSGVEVVRGDVLDPAFVASVVPGHDAVVSGLGMRYRHPWARRESPDDFTSRATLHIVRAMEAAGLRRLVLISAAGVGDSRAAMNLPMRALLATSNVGVAYADLERVEAAVAETALDWQAVRPTTLTNGPRTDRIKLTDRYGTLDKISRQDVAAYMLGQVGASELEARTPMITSA